MTTETPRKLPTRRPGRPRVNADPQRLYAELPGALLERVRAYTAEREQSLTWFVRKAVEEKLQREKK